MTEHNTFGPIRTLDAAELILWTVYDPPRLLASYCLCSPSLFALLHFLYLLPVLATEEMMDDEEEDRTGREAVDSDADGSALVSSLSLSLSLPFTPSRPCPR